MVLTAPPVYHAQAFLPSGAAHDFPPGLIPGSFNVRDYGAAGDGVTNDTAAITAAITAIPAAGGTLYFPAGTYVTSGGFTIAVPCTIRGEGCDGIQDATGTGTSIVTCTSATAVLFTVTASIARFVDIGLVNTHGTPTNGAGIRVTTTDTFGRVNYDGISVRGFWTGIDAITGSVWTMRGCYVADCHKYGLRIRNTLNEDQGDFAISDSFFYFDSAVVGVAGADCAIRIEGGGGGKIVNTRINGFLDALLNGIELYVANNILTGELFIANTTVVGWTRNGFDATLGGNNALWIKARLVGCHIESFDPANDTGHAIEFTGLELGSGSPFPEVFILGCLLKVTTAAANTGAAIVLTNCTLSRVEANQQDGYATMLAATGTQLSVTDASGSIAEGVAVTGASAAGYVPVGTTASTAVWAVPAWQAWAAYQDMITRTPGLVGYWRLGEPSGTTATDASASPANGTYINTPTLGVASALSGNADTSVTFAGASSEGVALGTVAKLNIATTITVEAWVKATGTGGMIFAHRADTGAGTQGYSLQLETDGTLRYLFGNASQSVSNAVGSGVANGSWHHVAMVRDGAAVRVYKDGAEVYANVSIAAQIGSMAVSCLASIGFWTAYGGYYTAFTGSLDEVAVYSRALSPIEVNMHYRVGHGS